MSTMERAPRRIEWTSTDEAISAVLDRHNDLHRRWREATTLAQAASERIATAARSHQERRAQALAAGKPDVGAFDPATLQAQADESAATRDALADAFAISHAQALNVADEWQAEWTQAARERLDGARNDLAELLDQVEAAHAVYAGAWRALALAVSPEARRRRGKTLPAPAPNVAELRTAIAGSPEQATAAAMIAADA